MTVQKARLSDTRNCCIRSQASVRGARPATAYRAKRQHRLQVLGHVQPVPARAPGLRVGTAALQPLPSTRGIVRGDNFVSDPPELLGVSGKLE